MASERNYGNTSKMENTLRSRYASTHANATYASSSDVIPPDCISCRKDKTGIIPSNKRCKLICGKALISRKEIKEIPGYITADEAREIVRMKKLINNN